jgi:hypothetical protein
MRIWEVLGEHISKFSRTIQAGDVRQICIESFCCGQKGELEWMNEWMNEWTNEWTNEWMNERKKERTKERMNERMNEWMNECIN